MLKNPPDFRRVILCAATLTLAACGQGNGSANVPGAASFNDAARPIGKIAHVIVIVQENRTVDNLFQSLPGANTASYGYNEYGQRINLHSELLTAGYDLKHKHIDWLRAYNQGKMNGWNFEKCINQCPSNPAYAYVPQYEVQPYYTMAETYTFADEMFHSDQGPSLPAHQYLVSGTSAIYNGASLLASEDPPGKRDQGGCDSSKNTRVQTIDPNGHQGGLVFPCFDRKSIFTLLDAAGVSWRYYQAKGGAGVWHAVDALQPIWQNKQEYNQNVVVPSSQVLNDIYNGRLASVAFVTPTASASDHAGVTDGSGPSWVASVVDAIGSSQYWSDTAILVTWDDWGGWFDHVKPTVYNAYEVGMRVPFMVISPYAKPGHVSHVKYEFGSILKFIEETYGLPSLGTTDQRANDLSDCFNFGAAPRKFVPISAKYSARYFLQQPPDTRPIDD